MTCKNLYDMTATLELHGVTFNWLVVLGFNVPPRVKVIWRQDLRL